MSILKMTSFDGLDSAVLPKDDWVLRNFGWATFPGPTPAATASRRTAAETAEVVKFINAQLLPK